MSDWLDVMLEEIARKKRETEAAVEEKDRRRAESESGGISASDPDAALDEKPAGS